MPYAIHDPDAWIDLEAGVQVLNGDQALVFARCRKLDNDLGRGVRQGNTLLNQEIAKAGGVDFTKPLLLGYTGLSDLLLQKYIEDSASIWKGGTDNLNYTAIGSVIGTHAGPGAIAAAFFKNT